MSRLLILNGSARHQKGDTQAALDACFGSSLTAHPHITINLASHHIEPYDYTHRNQGDDFLSIAQQMAEARTILFATPVYWYAMSGIMKNFFDRFTDLITIQKPLGRALAGRQTFLLACGAGAEIPPGFTEPFRATSDYLDMRYQGHFYWHSRSNAPEKQLENATAFGTSIIEN